MNDAEREEARAEVARLKEQRDALADHIADMARMRPVVEAAMWVRDHQYGEHAANHEQLLAAIRAAVDAYRAGEQP